MSTLDIVSITRLKEVEGAGVGPVLRQESTMLPGRTGFVTRQLRSCGTPSSSYSLLNPTLIT